MAVPGVGDCWSKDRSASWSGQSSRATVRPLNCGGGEQRRQDAAIQSQHARIRTSDRNERRAELELFVRAFRVEQVAGRISN